MKCSLSDRTMTQFCKSELDMETATDLELHINYCFDCQLRFIEAWDTIRGEEPHKSQKQEIEISSFIDWERVRNAPQVRTQLQQLKAKLHRQRSAMSEVTNRLLRQNMQIYQSLNLLKRVHV